MKFPDKLFLEVHKFGKLNQIKIQSRVVLRWEKDVKKEIEKEKLEDNWMRIIKENNMYIR